MKETYCSANNECLAYLKRKLNRFLNMVPENKFQCLNIDLFGCFVILDFNFIDLWYLKIIKLMLYLRHFLAKLCTEIKINDEVSGCVSIYIYVVFSSACMIHWYQCKLFNSPKPTWRGRDISMLGSSMSLCAPSYSSPHTLPLSQEGNDSLSLRCPVDPSVKTPRV